MIDDGSAGVSCATEGEVSLERKRISSMNVCVGFCGSEKDLSKADGSNYLKNTECLTNSDNEISISRAHTVKGNESLGAPASDDGLLHLMHDSKTDEEMSRAIIRFCESKWWWFQPCSLKPNTTDSQIELSPEDVKAELLLLYDLFDSPRACRMRGEFSESVQSFVIIPNDEDLEESARRGLPFVVILRFTLWFYLILTDHLCRACLSAHFGLTSAETLRSDKTLCPIPPSEIFSGAAADRGDWLELLSVFLPYDWTPAVLRRAFAKSLSGANSQTGAARVLPFLSWRRSAQAEMNAAGDFAVLAEVPRGTNSARHGAVNPLAAFRIFPKETQWFLFHGEFYVLYHREKCARRASHRFVQSDAIESPKSCGDDFYANNECLGDNDAHAIVEYAEALLLPHCRSSSSVHSSSSSSSLLHSSSSSSSSSSSVHSSAPAIPETLMSVCAGAFCFPRELADGDGAELLSSWGFYSKEDKHMTDEHISRGSEEVYAAVTEQMPTDVFVKHMCEEVLLRDTSVLTSSEYDRESDWFVNASKAGEVLFSDFATTSNSLVSPLPLKPIAGPLVQTFSDVLANNTQ